ncbi:tRNA rRNA methyltransferase SpoU [Paucilactobacillus oligofermentans DSM 15707 = LMG 22743]|uniref:tRNA rRNA methyltransferase SpoU n=1 Tax=Paucilactobacillus oligofermentans DSM 15707 = LMG 22743 TaxID=1423778 RepID=A0A0R1RN74_9LACO|nr:RNA methyltransferase [Paucilactobacillus oligofermentans]KRL55946.1 tRNA rRNA methyltransferase SpoU [Paucilactobacillus oligofermentans DSM 15707 = LMG 22743]CUS26072.1 RNA methyltransferase, TrmH family protein [Paucilactobacillus oligofermentans DSM 15707 = LMG 22743]
MENISSVQNQKVKNWKKLATKKQRTKEGSYLLDGWHLVQEALNYDAPIKAIMVTQEQFDMHSEELQKVSEIFIVTFEVMQSITDTVTPQGIAAEVGIPAVYTEVPNELAGTWLLMDEVQDPGNMGTMIRTADAAGFTGVVAGNKTADIFSPKVVRAMQGSQFHIQVKQGSTLDWIDMLHAEGIPVYGTQLNKEAVNYLDVEKSNSFALIMGNEGNGVQPAVLERTSQNLYIPIAGKAESLNVAVSAGILMFALKK